MGNNTNHLLAGLLSVISDIQTVNISHERLMLDFHNLLRDYHDLSKENVRLNQSIGNYSSEFSTKLKYLLVEIQEVTAFNKNQKRNITALESVTGVLHQKAGKLLHLKENQMNPASGWNFQRIYTIFNIFVHV